MKISRKLFIAAFLAVLFLGFFFRFYHLGQTPEGLYLDEASIGYNSYSILKTGQDEYGKSFPLLFRSVGDFKTPIYVYLAVPFISLYDLTPFAVRLPSALFGFLTIPMLYLLVKKLTLDKHGEIVALLSAFFLSISPWHIILSRTAYESTVALFLLLLATYFFLIALKKYWIYPLSAVFFATSFLAYHAERIVTPIVVIFLIVHYRKEIFAKFAQKLFPLIVSLLLGLLIIGPTLFLMRSPGFLKRAGSLNIFSYSNQMPYGYSLEKINIINPNLFNNKYLLSAKEFASLYVSYFSPRYLFFLGDSIPRSSLPGLGSFFVWELPLYLFGLYELVKNKDIDLKYFVITLLIISPIPAALTRDPYSIIRALPMLIPLIIILSLGALNILNLLRRISRKILIPIILVILGLSLTRFYISLYYYNDYFNYSYWSYGWQQAVATISSLDPKFPVIVDNSRGEPYTNILFFLKFAPATYQQTNHEVNPAEYYNDLSRNHTKYIGNITVKKIDWGVDSDHVEQYLVGDTLTISDAELHNHRLIKISDILNPDGTVAIRIVKTTPLKP